MAPLATRDVLPLIALGIAAVVFTPIVLTVGFVSLWVAATLIVIYLAWHICWRFKLRETYYVRTLPADVVAEGETNPAAITSKRVCVIGGGLAGLVATKELLEEGHKVVLYEKLPTYGGTFLYGENKGGVYDSCMLTIGNYMMTFSDFFTPGEKYRFWHHTEYFDYLTRYVQHNRLTARAQMEFNTEVRLVERAGQGWRVTTRSSKGEKVELFDSVAICNGAHQQPDVPKIPGMDKTSIHICHSETYKRASNDPRFQNKRVVCVGIGETGADISAEVAEVAATAYLSIKRTPHVVPRNIWNLGYPGDAFSSRAMFYCNHKYINFLHESDQDLKVKTGKSPFFIKLFKGFMGLGDPLHAKVGELASTSGGKVTDQFLTKNDAFIPHLLDGTLLQRPPIERFEGKNTVVFKDGSRAEVDTVIFSTGYLDIFPFLKDVKIDSVRDLYKHSFHPDIGPSLAWIGFVRPGTGGVPAAAEMVARYFALLCSNKRKLPDDIHERIAKERGMEEGLLKLSAGRVKTLVMYADFMETMAQHIGCAPNMLRVLFTEPFLWYRMMYGTLTSIQYRLVGPHAQPQFARDCIKHIPVPTPLPFQIAQSVCAVLGWIGGTLFGYRPTSW